MTSEKTEGNLYNESDKSTGKNIPESPDVSENKNSSKSPNSDNEQIKEDAINDQQTDQAVDDIVRHESDEVLAAEDASFGITQTNQPKTIKEKLAHALRTWWDNKRLRYATLAAAGLVILIVAFWPPARNLALNTVGLRGNASITVLDQTTGLPLKNVSAIMANQKTFTNNNGVAVFKNVRLGNQKITVQKIAFAPVTQIEKIGVGGNKLGKVSLKAIGVQYKFVVTDYLSGKPIQKAEVTSGGSSAFSNKNGKAILTALSSKLGLLPVTISANGYRNTSSSVPVGSKATSAVQLVASGKEVYISNSSGHYNVYKSDIDGRNKQLLLAGTGNETSNVALIVSPDNKEAALVSTRDNIRDADGYLLSALTLINISTGTPITIDHAEQIDLIGWVGTRIVYSETVAGASAANSERERIMSYDYSKNLQTTLTTANQFNAIIEAEGSIYYAISSTDPSAQADFFKVNADNTDRQTLLDKEVWTIIRTDYNTLALQTQTGWYNYSLNSKQVTQSDQPSIYTSYTFIDDQAGDKSLWTDNRDGKGVLLVHNVKSNQDTTITSQGGLTDPTRWLNSSVAIYRVSTPQETADYAVSLQGGVPKKIADVSPSSGISTNIGY